MQICIAKPKGLTLIEITLAMAVAGLLMAGVYSIASGTFELSAEVEENRRALTALGLWGVLTASTWGALQGRVVPRGRPWTVAMSLVGLGLALGLIGAWLTDPSVDPFVVRTRLHPWVP